MGAVDLLAPDPPVLAKTLTVCLVGMPNAGKTSLMNQLTGGHLHTANYPGVTVTYSRGKSASRWGPEMHLVDIPGVHSPFEPSPEEDLACQIIAGRHKAVQPDAFILVADATQLERHLKFAGHVARQGRPLVVALTMTDLFPRLRLSVDVPKLADALGVPMVVVDGRTGEGSAELLAQVKLAAERPVPMNVLRRLPEDPVEAYRAVDELLERSGALISARSEVLTADRITARIDRIVLHRYFGFPIFFVILAGLFAAIFWAARPFMEGIDAAFSAAGNLVIEALPGNVLARFVGEGLIGGVGAVAVFFPQIVILFFLMTMLEDSGYLARGAALVDRPLSALGLHGRSFVPMISGFACAIPAVFAARSIPSHRERLLTIWILPLMSCSARLPVYALLLAALLPAHAAWTAGFSLAGIYLLSLVAGALVAGMTSRLVLRKRFLSVLAMELPLYRRPQWKPIFRVSWLRSSSYLKRAGVPIVVVSAALWLLSNFGFGSHTPVEAAVSSATLVAQADLENSFAGRLGHTLEPVLKPMGVDWRVGVGLISAFAAREVFVSSMAIIFHVSGDEQDQQPGLLEQMRSATFANTSQHVFTPATIIGLIVFFFFSLQCFSTVAVVRKETNSSRFAVSQLLFYTGFGYVAAVMFVQGLRFLGVS
ncbi:MAG: ferrous iron transporter B [Acidobacteria bacterium]|nr:ferrous iron transporter B [Acidobacteriota bacterium]